MFNLPTMWSIKPDHAAFVINRVLQAFQAGEADDAQRQGLPLQKVGSMAIVTTRGGMIKQAGKYAAYWGLAGTRDAQNALIAAGNDADVEQIVWVMDTPGGDVDGLAELADVVRSVAAKKPVNVQVDGLLASAGYYAAAGATKIYAAKDNLVGSIGVRTYMVDSSEAYGKEGYKVIPIDTGEHKSAGLPGTVITEAQIAETQRIVDGYYESFLNVIQTGRNMSRATLAPLADGRVFFAQDAVGLGLIDGVQTLSQTLAQAQQQPRFSTRRARATLAALDIK